MRNAHLGILLGIFVCQAISAEETKIAISDVKDIWSYDWYYSGFNRNSRESEQRILALRPGTKSTQGTAWLITSSQSTKTKRTNFSCLKGVYEIAANNENDGLLMQLGFTRKYKATGPQSRLSWQQDMGYNHDRVGGMFDIPLKNRKLSTARVTFANSSLFYVSEDGRPKAVYSGGLISILKNDTITPFAMDNWYEGEIRSFSKSGGSIEAIKKSPPPGFSERNN